MATTRSKVEAERLLAEQIEAERIEREQVERELYGGDTEPDAYAKIRAYCSTVGTEDSLGIYRQLPQKQEMFICKITADEFDPETIKSRFGGGTFIIKGYDDKNKIRLRQVISIEGEPIIESKAVAAPAQQAPAAPAFDMQALLAAMQENNRQLLSALTQVQHKERSTADMLEEMKLMRDVFAPASAAPQYNPVEMMKLGMEMAGGEGNNAWVSKMIDVFGKPIIDGMVAAKTQTSAAPARPSLPAAKASATPQAQSLTEEETAVNLMLKGYIKMIGNAAAKNENVAEYADTILNLLPEPSLPEVEVLLRADDWQAKLAAYSPAVNEHPVWFANLRDTLLAYIDEDRAALTQPGSGGNVIGHENADPSKTSDNGDAGGLA